MVLWHSQRRAIGQSPKLDFSITRKILIYNRKEKANHMQTWRSYRTYAFSKHIYKILNRHTLQTCLRTPANLPPIHCFS